MNKRIRKKHKNKKYTTITYFHCLEKQWSTNAPHWKRIKVSGQKRMARVHFLCIGGPNQNHRESDYLWYKKPCESKA